MSSVSNKNSDISNDSANAGTGMLNHFFGNFGGASKSATAASVSDGNDPTTTIDAGRRTQMLSEGGANDAELRQATSVSQGGAKKIHERDQFTVRDDDWFNAANNKSDAGSSTIPAFSSLRSWFSGGGSDEIAKEGRRPRKNSLTDADLMPAQAEEEGPDALGHVTHYNLRGKAKAAVDEAKDTLSPIVDDTEEKIRAAHARGWTPLTAKSNDDPSNSETWSKRIYNSDADALGFGQGTGLGAVQDIDPDYRTYQREAEGVPSSGAYYRPHQEGPQNNWVAISNMYQQRYIQKQSKAKDSGRGSSAMGKDQPSNHIAASENESPPVNQNALIPAAKRLGRAIFGERTLFGFNNDNAYIGDNTSGNAFVEKDGSFETVNMNNFQKTLVSKITDDDVAKNSDTALKTMSVGIGGVDDEYSPNITPTKKSIYSHEVMKSRPLNPSELTAYHHSDCSPQLEGYEQCLDVNGGNYEKCRGSWDTFSSCQERLSKDVARW